MKQAVPAARTVKILTKATRNVTVVQAYLDGILVTADAKREPGDKPDAAVGADLATARALALLAARLERRARGAIRHAESIKADHQARQARTSAQEQNRDELIARLTGTAPEAVTAGERHEHQDKHDPHTVRTPGCPLCASWRHPASAVTPDQRRES